MRILSYNIHKGIGGRDRQYSLERIIDVIESQNPDLICLQEVDRHVARSRHDDQPRLLAEQFHAVAHDFQLNVHLKEGGYGNLLLSRWPFLSHHHISLRYKERKTRGAQVAVVDTPEGPLHLANWHLSLTARMRLWQSEHLLAHRLFRESLHLPTLIIGDTNDWRNQLWRAPFHNHGFRQVTSPPTHFRSFPAYLPMGSLDKAFLKGPLRVTNAHVSRRQPAVDASDHLPLILDLDMEALVPHHSVTR